MPSLPQSNDVLTCMSELCCAAWLAWLGFKMCVVETRVVPGLVVQQEGVPREWFGAFSKGEKGN